MTLPQFFALFAAVIYAGAALLIKRSAELGVGVWRTAFVSNLIIGLCFQPLLVLGGTLHRELWWQPIIVAIAFVAGQWFTFVSLEQGDVSVATPVLGIKILLVAFLLTLLNHELIRSQLWLAAFLATVGIALLSRSTGSAHHHVTRTVITAGLAATSYALFDVLLQKWSPAWGMGRFVPIAMGASGVLSIGFTARFHAPLRQIPQAAWPWLIGGAVGMSAQSLLFVSAIAKWGHAATANVIYSSRGLWSVLLVWLVGHWVKSREQHLGRRVLAWRLAGAALMMSAIVLALR